jgi:ubiquinone/menaquinone biosynthesis C-methylase UbiE
MKLDPRYTTKEFWANHSPYQPQTFPAARVLAEQVADMAVSATALPAAALVLEVGAGNGAFSGALSARFQLVALDLSHGLLLGNPVRLRVEGDVFSLPFSTGTFDLVIASAMLHHVGSVPAALAEMTRVSREHVVALEPNRNNPLLAAYGLLKGEERGLLPFTANWLSSQAQTAGLVVTECFSFGWISPNKTPTLLLPLFQRLPLRHALGLNLLLVARKPPK